MDPRPIRSCYRCSAVALWHILVDRPDGAVREAFACEEHAREHMREPIEVDWGLPHAMPGTHLDERVR
jgi:hypothetical protein